MTTKEWLARAWRVDREVDALLAARDKAFVRCTSTTSALKDVVISGGVSGTGTDLAKLGDLEREIDARIGELTKLKSETLRVINTVPDSTLRTLLINRYINFMTWERIAVDMDYSYSQVVKHLHPKALNFAKDAIECHTLSVL